MLQLGDYLRETGQSAASFARSLGLDPSTLSLAINRKTIPLKENVEAIYVATNGAVEPNDFYDLPALPAAGDGGQ